MPFTWLATRDALSPAALTVRAQALPVGDEGELIYDRFFPRQNVDSVTLQDVSTLDYRPTSDRREWDARGRRIPPAIPARRTVEIVPVEANEKIGEYEMQKLFEGRGGVNEQVLQDIIGTRIPQRVDRMVQANYRRLEVDAMNAWSLGQITQRNPENAAQTYAATFGFAAARYTTAGTAWNDAGVNAYDLFLAWIAAGQDLVGPIEGAMMRLATFNAILADAPNLPNTVKMTRQLLSERIAEDADLDSFEILINERAVDIFDDGGLAYTRTKIWPAQRVAAIPQGETVGYTAHAPVIRAMELASQVGPAAGIDVRGQAVYYHESNGGRELDIEVQVNALSVPDEQKMYVINAGV